MRAVACGAWPEARCCWERRLWWLLPELLPAPLVGADAGRWCRQFCELPSFACSLSFSLPARKGGWSVMGECECVCVCLGTHVCSIGQVGAAGEEVETHSTAAMQPCFCTVHVTAPLCYLAVRRASRFATQSPLESSQPAVRFRRFRCPATLSR